jgi:hypothetical protein
MLSLYKVKVHIDFKKTATLEIQKVIVFPQNHRWLKAETT